MSSLFDTTSENPVVVSLIDFYDENLIVNCRNNLSNFNQLKDKMRNYRKRILFSMKFEEVYQLEPKGDPFQSASDTKISYNHNCICVADEANMRIAFFNLETREYMTSFKPYDHFLSWLSIEENYDNENNDAIYFGEYGDIYKFRIKDLLVGNSDVKFIWKQSKICSIGIAMRIIGNQKQLFCPNFEDKRMVIVDPTNGEIIGGFQLEIVSRIIDIIFITYTKMIVSELDTNKCYILESSTNEWKIIKVIEMANNLEISLPLGMTIDRVGQRVFISDCGNKRLIIVDDEGNILDTYSSTEKEVNPVSLCFDERTGLLYVTDQERQCVRVFK